MGRSLMATPNQPRSSWGKICIWSVLMKEDVIMEAWGFPRVAGRSFTYWSLIFPNVEETWLEMVVGAKKTCRGDANYFSVVSWMSWNIHGMPAFLSILETKIFKFCLRWNELTSPCHMELAQVRDVKEKRYKAQDVVAIKRGFDVPGAASFLFGGMSYG